MNLRRLGLGLLLVLAFSCGDDEKEPRTREEFCKDWAEAACSEETVSACQAEDAESCRAAQASWCADRIPEDFSDEMGQVCIDAVKAAYRDGDLQGGELATVLSLGGACDKLIKGDKDEGEDCDETSDCDAAGGFVCVRHSDEERGTCQIPQVVDAGRDCSSKQKLCEAGFYCNGDNCIEAKDAGDDCSIQEECGEDGFCSSEGQCETKLKTSEICTRDYECEEGICYEYEGEKTCTDRIRLGRSEPLCDDLK